MIWISSDARNLPVDLAPTKVNTDDIRWASNTTLDEGSDFYVANRGDNTIVRMRQDGSVVAIRRVDVGSVDSEALDDASLKGIATSPDGTKIYLTVIGLGKGKGARWKFRHSAASTASPRPSRHHAA